MTAAASPVAPVVGQPSQDRPPRVLMLGSFLSEQVAARSVGEELKARLASNGWSVVSASSRLGRIAKLTDMLGTIYQKRHQYDVAQVDVFSGPYLRLQELCCMLLRRLGKPFVLTLHGGNLPVTAQEQPHRIERLLRSAFAVTSPTSYMKEALPVPSATDIRVLPNPIALERYRYSLRTNIQPHCLWLRAFNHLYDPQTAVRAVALAAPKVAGLELRMVGRDKGDGSLSATRDLIASLGDDLHIEVQGNGVPNAKVPDQMASSDLFLNTSTVDNTPVTVLEALATGLPVVSSRVGGIPYLLEHERHALLVPAADERAFAEAIVRLVTDPELCQRLSHQGRQLAKAHDWNHFLPQWQSLFIEAAAS